MTCRPSTALRPAVETTDGLYRCAIAGIEHEGERAAKSTKVPIAPAVAVGLLGTGVKSRTGASFSPGDGPSVCRSECRRRTEFAFVVPFSWLAVPGKEHTVAGGQFRIGLRVSHHLVDFQHLPSQLLAVRYQGFPAWQLLGAEQTKPLIPVVERLFPIPRFGAQQAQAHLFQKRPLSFLAIVRERCMWSHMAAVFQWNQNSVETLGGSASRHDGEISVVSGHVPEQQQIAFEPNEVIQRGQAHGQPHYGGVVPLQWFAVRPDDVVIH